ncbi:MAG: hypothetical protein KG028_16245 [Actinobacteria bacterium]|jgi:nucleoid-associated protein YgaU|nr:hypothetical protein [Actinomycetota bacterium]
MTDNVRRAIDSRRRILPSTPRRTPTARAARATATRGNRGLAAMAAAQSVPVAERFVVFVR